MDGVWNRRKEDGRSGEGCVLHKHQKETADPNTKNLKQGILFVVEKQNLECNL